MLNATSSCGDAVSAPRRITHELVAGLGGRYRAVVSPTEPGIVAGTGLLAPWSADPVGAWHIVASEGQRVEPGQPVLHLEGDAWEISVAEDHAMGILGFAGGIAGRSMEIKAQAPHGLRVVCGAWKKLPAAMKPALRAGLDVAGLSHRLLDGDFVYVGKNQVAMFGDVVRAVTAALGLGHGPVSVQVVDVEEALRAVGAGADVVMVDTGRLADLDAIGSALRSRGIDVLLAYAGGVDALQLRRIAYLGADIVDIGRAVLDAPLWDLHMEVR
jgi:nicotinate-nucleotide pyrophosphorylase (carboxylating)